MRSAPSTTRRDATCARSRSSERRSRAARALGGYPDATAARAVRIDRYGLDLRVSTPRGDAT